ncbi:MAG TPA: branched-chain amino acid ABC transporter substrate-binding protein [Chloroflexota bacterium]
MLLLAGCGGSAVPSAPTQQPGQVRAISSGQTSASVASVAASATAAPAVSPTPATVLAAPAAAPLKIGLVAPFSGLAAAFGAEMLKAAQMALDEANGSGGVAGRQLAIDQADDKGDAASAGSAAAKLVTDGVTAAIGPATSASALAAEGPLNQAKIPAITPAANDPRVTDQGLPFIFRTAGRWDQEPPLLAEALLKQPGSSKVAVVADQSAYGQGLAEGLRQALAKGGSQPAADETVNAGTKDFGPLAAKLKALSTNAVFYGGYASEGATLAKSLRAAGVPSALAMGDAGQDQGLISSGGAAAEGLLLAYPPDPSATPAAAFLEAYKRRYGTPASLYAVSTYDTARLLIDALRRAGSGDGDAVRQALAATRDFNGLYWGKMSFDSKGDLQAKTYVLWRVRNSRFEPVDSRK